MDTAEARSVSVPQPLVVAPPAGDPLVLGLGSFVAGATVVGFDLTGVFAGAPVYIAITLGSSALGLLIATFWAARLGQTFVAAVTGLFSSFWFSLAILLLGLNNGWFGDTTALGLDPLRAYFWTWGIVFLLLTIASLRLPLAFVLVIGGVDLTLILLALAYSGDSPTTGLIKLAGWVLWASGVVGAIVFLSSGMVSLGGKGMSPGPPVVK